MSDQQTFKKGDRVRITDVLEDEVVRVDEPKSGVTCTGPAVKFRGGFTFYPERGNQDTYDAPYGWERTIEKLAPPEPNWVDGDVIRWGDDELHRIGGEWYWSDGGAVMSGDEVVATAWESGHITVIRKADQERPAA